MLVFIGIYYQTFFQSCQMIFFQTKTLQKLENFFTFIGYKSKQLQLPNFNKFKKIILNLFIKSHNILLVFLIFQTYMA